LTTFAKKSALLSPKTRSGGGTSDKWRVTSNWQGTEEDFQGVLPICDQAYPNYDSVTDQQPEASVAAATKAAPFRGQKPPTNFIRAAEGMAFAAARVRRKYVRWAGKAEPFRTAGGGAHQTSRSVAILDSLDSCLPPPSTLPHIGYRRERASG
jgi:hypothetical protein